MKYLDHIDETAAIIGAINTVKVSDGKLIGFNTDAPGFIDALKQEYGKLSDARVAVVGAGGAARACLSALQVQGASVTVFARDLPKATELAADFRIDLQKLETDHSKPIPVFSDFDIVVNTTPLGTCGENVNKTVATADQLRDVKLVYDLVYNPSETLLLNEARKAGAKTVGGFEMLIAQAARQFKIWTGIDPPVDEMAAAARKKLDER
jgi:shikimate dehydrogenase